MQATSRPPADRPSPPASEGSATISAFRWAARLVVGSTAVLWFHLTTQGTWDPARELPQAGTASRFFLAQANSLVHANFPVDPTQLPGECYVRLGRCYGYYGLTPSILRIPLLPLLNDWGSLTPLYLWAALTLATWAAVDVTRRAWERLVDPEDRSPAARSAVALFVLTALALGPGSVLVQLTRPAMYEEAIAWAVAFACLALRSVWRWTERQHPGHLVAAVVFLALGAGARPTILPAAMAIAVFVLWRWWTVRNPGPDVAAVTAEPAGPTETAGPRRPPLVPVLGVGAAIGPLVSSLGVYWLKFRTFIPDLRINESVRATPAWTVILDHSEGATTGAKFIPTSVWVYLRPDSVRWTDDFPWVGYRFPATPIAWLPPLQAGGAYVEPLTSVTTSMPLLFLLTVGAVVWATAAVVRSIRSGDRPLLATSAATSFALLAAGATSLVVTTSNVAITNRYLGDFYPFLAIGAAVAPGFLAAWTRRSRGVRIGLVTAATLLVIWSMWINLGLLSTVWPAST